MLTTYIQEEWNTDTYILAGRSNEIYYGQMDAT